MKEYLIKLLLLSFIVSFSLFSFSQLPSKELRFKGGVNLDFDKELRLLSGYNLGILYRRQFSIPFRVPQSRNMAENSSIPSLVKIFNFGLNSGITMNRFGNIRSGISGNGSVCKYYTIRNYYHMISVPLIASTIISSSENQKGIFSFQTGIYFSYMNYSFQTYDCDFSIYSSFSDDIFPKQFVMVYNAGLEYHYSLGLNHQLALSAEVFTANPLRELEDVRFCDFSLCLSYCFVIEN